MLPHSTGCWPWRLRPERQGSPAGPQELLKGFKPDWLTVKFIIFKDHLGFNTKMNWKGIHFGVRERSYTVTMSQVSTEVNPNSGSGRDRHTGTLATPASTTLIAQRGRSQMAVGGGMTGRSGSGDDSRTLGIKEEERSLAGERSAIQRETSPLFTRRPLSMVTQNGKNQHVEVQGPQ